MADKPKVAFYWCAACGGCEEAVVDLAEIELGAGGEVAEAVGVDGVGEDRGGAGAVGVPAVVHEPGGAQ